MRSVLIAVLLAAHWSVPVHAAARDPREAPPQQPFVEGRHVFEAKGCVRCHRVLDEAPPAAIGPDLARSGSWRDVMQLAASLWNHKPAMAEKMHQLGIESLTVSPDEMGKLAGYLFAVRFFAEPGKAERGRTLFEERSCSQCHQLNGHGGVVGPRLDELKAYASSPFLAQALWNHGPEMAAKMAEMKLARPHLDDGDVADIAAYMRGDATQIAERALAYAQAGSPHAGKAIFATKGCSQCHAVVGSGATVGPDLGAQRARANVTAMAAALWNIGPTMWDTMKRRGVAVPKFTDPEMADLLAYLSFVQSMGHAGNAARGGELFRQKSCAHCHGIGAGPLGGRENLATSEAVHSPVHWAAAMWNHRVDLGQGGGDTVPARFDDDEMRDLVAYLQSLGGGKSAP
jgi:mono/diheme cytochrome c family protein